MHSSGKNSLAVGLSPYKIAKKDVLASKLAGRLFSPFMGFSLLSEMEFFAVPKNGISLNI